jgi:hypothetical protein
MPNISTELNARAPHHRRILYRRFVKAVVSGELRALRLLSDMRIPNTRQGESRVRDYAYPLADTDLVRQWLDAVERPPHLITAAEADALDDSTLIALIERQRAELKTKLRKSVKRARQGEGTRG